MKFGTWKWLIAAQYRRQSVQIKNHKDSIACYFTPANWLINYTIIILALIIDFYTNFWKQRCGVCGLGLCILYLCRWLQLRGFEANLFYLLRKWIWSNINLIAPMDRNFDDDVSWSGQEFKSLSCVCRNWWQFKLTYGQKLKYYFKYFAPELKK